MKLGIRFEHVWEWVYRDASGGVRWSGRLKNLVPDAWLNGILNGTSSYGATLYVLLVDNASFSAFAGSDTMASHPGWIEFTNYSEAQRQTATLSTATALSRTNSASPATFTFLGSGTIKGAALTTSNTKGGATGDLAGEVVFGGGDQAVSPGGTLTVTATITAASV